MNNIYEDDIYEDDIFEDEPEQIRNKPAVKHTYGQYENVFLTDREYEEIKQKRGKDFDGILSFYSERKAEKGYTVNNDYYAILGWGTSGFNERRKPDIAADKKEAKEINIGHFDSASFEDGEWTEDADSVFKCRADLAYRSIIRKVAERHIEVLPGETEPQAFIRYVSEKVRKMLRGEFDKPKVEQPIRYTVDIDPNEPFRRENETYRQAATRHRLNGY